MLRCSPSKLRFRSETRRLRLTPARFTLVISATNEITFYFSVSLLLVFSPSTGSAQTGPSPSSRLH